MADPTRREGPDIVPVTLRRLLSEGGTRGQSFKDEWQTLGRRTGRLRARVTLTHTALLLIRLVAWWAGVGVLSRGHWWWWSLAMQVVDDGS